MDVDLTVDQMVLARTEDLVRLALHLGIDQELLLRLIQKPDARFRLACTIARWYKRHPQSRSEGPHTSQGSRTRRRPPRGEGTVP